MQGQWGCDERWEGNDYKEFLRIVLRVIYNIILIVLDLYLHILIKGYITHFKHMKFIVLIIHP